MKLSELIATAQLALSTNGDIDVCIPCPDETIDEGVTEASITKVRPYGGPYIPVEKWKDSDHRVVFVIG